MSRDNTTPFGRGETFYGGGTIDTSNLAGVDLEGQEKVFEDVDYGSASPGARPSRSAGRRVVCRCVRNNSGAALLGKRLVQFEAGNPNRVAGYAIDPSTPAYPLDEFLPAGGVPNGDLCWVVVEGPAMCVTPVTGALFNGDIAAAGILQAASTSGGSTQSGTTAAAGRVANYTVVAATTAGQFTGLINYLENGIFKALTAKTTAQTNADILVHVFKKW